MLKPRAEYIQSNYVIVFAMLYCMALVIPVVLAYRPVAFGFFSAIPGGALIFPSTYLFGDIISEVYGYKIARQILWCSIGAEILFALGITAVIYSPFPKGWQQYHEYVDVLGHSLRFVMASILGTTISEFVNIYIISKSKIYYKGRHFWLRSLFSSATGEIILTIIVYSITFMGIFSFMEVIRLMINGYLYKVAFSTIGVIPVVLITTYLKKKENIDVYDHSTNFNPFIFALENSHLKSAPKSPI